MKKSFQNEKEQSKLEKSIRNQRNPSELQEHFAK